MPSCEPDKCQLIYTGRVILALQGLVTLVLVLVMVAQIVLILPSIHQWRENVEKDKEDDRRLNALEEQRRKDTIDHDKLIEDSRKTISINQAAILVASERNKRITEENLKLSEDLHKKLKERLDEENDIKSKEKR